MSRKILVSILLISIIVSFAASVTVIAFFSFAASRSTMTDTDWERLETMSFKEAQDYISAHSVEMNRLDILKEQFSSPDTFFFFITWYFLKFFVPVFFASVITAWMVSRKIDSGSTCKSRSQ